MADMPHACSSFSTPPRLQWHIFAVLWLLGMPGMSALVWQIVPQWLRTHSLPLNQTYPPVVQLLLLGTVLALVVGLGVLLAPRVGLAAPVLTTWIAGRSPRDALKRMWLPGVAGGIAGAAWLLTLAVLWPDTLRAVEPLYSMSLLPKLLYGSLTSELLVRWGMLVCVFWGVWRLSGSQQPPSLAQGWLAVALGAVLWALAHWLIAFWLLGDLPDVMLVHLMLGRIVYGLMAGFLCWRFGLEAALLAHMLMDVLAHGLIGPVL